MVTTPGPAIALAGAKAVNCVASISVVTSGEPFHSTTAPERKPEPLTVNVNAGPPAATEAGAMLVTVGACVVIGNVAVLEVTPLGLIRVTMAAPAAATRFAGTVAVACVALAKVVERGEPFQRRTQLVAKLTPVAVRVNDAEPSVAEAGERA